MQEHAGAGLEQVLVDEAHDADVVLGPRGAADNGMVVVNHLLEGANAHGTATHVIHTATLVGHAVLARLRARGGALLGGLGLAQALLVLDIFFLKEQVVVDALHAQQAELASARGVDGGELCGGTRTGGLPLLATDTGGRPRRWLVLGLLLLLRLRSAAARPARGAQGAC